MALKISTSINRRLEELQPEYDTDTKQSPPDDNAAERGHWDTTNDFLITAIGSSVGFGNLWRFPKLCFKHGGGAFLVPYFFFAFTILVPILFLEQSIGQFTQRSCPEVWSIAPYWKGLGYGILILAQFINIYFPVIISWSAYYTAGSFYKGLSILGEENRQVELAWSTCANAWNTPCCIEIGHTRNNSNAACNYGNATVLAEVEYWEHNVLKISRGIDVGYGSLNWHLFAAYSATWLFLITSLSNGIKSTAKVAWVTATVPMLMIVILCIHSCMLPNAWLGIKKYITVDLGALRHPDAWKDAGTQIFWSYSIGLAQHITLGSYNRRDTKLFNLTVWQVVVGASTSIVSGFMVFGTLGFIAGEQGVEVEDVVRGGSGLTFIAYPIALSLMPYARIWAIVFFGMLFMLGVDSVFGQLESIVTAICDAYHNSNPGLTMKEQAARHTKVLVSVCGATYLVGLSMITSNGMYVFNWMDHYGVSGLCLLSFGFFQCFVVAWVYGTDRYWGQIKHLMGLNSSWMNIFPICWKWVTPLTTISVLGLYLKDGMPKLTTKLNYDPAFESVYPLWSHILGWMLTTLSIICLPGYAIIRYSKQR